MEKVNYSKEVEAKRIAPRTTKINNTSKDTSYSALQCTFFIISALLVGLAVYHTTLTSLIQHYWTASGIFAQRQWDNAFEFCGKDEFNVAVWGSFTVTFLAYWIVGGIYTIMDATGFPAFFLKYKIQQAAEYPIPMSKIAKVIVYVLFNQFAVGLPIILLSYKVNSQFVGINVGKLPTLHWALFELCVFMVIEEICFYYSHRLLHHPRVYKYIHKQHHEWTSPIAITAVYCHPVEHIFSNVLPASLGPIVMGSHWAMAWLWFVLVILSTLNSHSGFNLPLFPSSEAHNIHHQKFTQNYGVMGYLDRFHGTASPSKSSSSSRFSRKGAFEFWDFPVIYTLMFASVMGASQIHHVMLQTGDLKE